MIVNAQRLVVEQVPTIYIQARTFSTRLMYEHLAFVKVIIGEGPGELAASRIDRPGQVESTKVLGTVDLRSEYDVKETTGSYVLGKTVRQREENTAAILWYEAIPAIVPTTITRTGGRGDVDVGGL